MTVLGVVCARSGSEGCPGKNVRQLANGERAIERAIRVAYEAGCDDVVVSTDYRPNVDYDTQGAYHIDRPKKLRGPDVGKWPVYRHAVRAWNGQPGQTADVAVDVDVSRPLRTAETVRRCIRATAEHGVVMAVARSDVNEGYDLMRWTSGGGVERVNADVNYTARQQLPARWLHAGVYAMTTDALWSRATLFGGKVWGVETDRIEALDVDDELDWRIVSLLDAYPPMHLTADAA